MPRNETIVSFHSARRRFIPFSSRVEYEPGHWQTQSIEPYAVSTIARDYIADGWRELTEREIVATFGRAKRVSRVTEPSTTIHRAFIKHTAGFTEPNAPVYIVTLTDRKRS